MRRRTLEVANQHPGLTYNEEALDAFLNALDALEAFTLPMGDLSIAFLEESTHTQLHADFMDDPTPTDVITFPGDPSMDFAGEICVSVDCANKVAAQHNHSFSQELSLYLIHGWLHLVGYDDIDPEDRKEMREAETAVMSALQEVLPNFELK
jgi:probable rRNA maturation factor